VQLLLPSLTRAVEKTVKSMISSSFSLGSAVYVRYRDHVLFKNIEQPVAEAIERETLGWFAKETEEIMLIEHDRAVPYADIGSSQGNGVIILKSCIVEMRELPLQENSGCHLNSSRTTVKDEYALPTKKRKTHLKAKN
jgi:hypothetical protein